MSSLWPSGTISDILRAFFSIIDTAVYWLLGNIYEILFTVANHPIIEHDTVTTFYNRIQLIIGVFMVFKLATSIIKGIVNPDSFTDKKAGISNIITRIMFAIVLLMALNPTIRIPNPQTSLEKSISNNGLLFGVLYNLQEKIINQNILGKLILGETEAANNNNAINGASSRADRFTGQIIKAFIHINLKDGKTDANKSENYACEVAGLTDQEKKRIDGIIEAYKSDDYSATDLLALVNTDCKASKKTGIWEIIGLFPGNDGDKVYVFTYTPLISTIVGVIIGYILIGEIITIAIRAAKLAILRLLAPIPIISYIDPKSEKDGAFGAWVKNLTSTYLELFIHLIVIFFILFIIDEMITNGFASFFNEEHPIISSLSCIFVIIGLFFFIKQAPKFIKDILGIKGGGSNVGLATMLGGAAMLTGGGGFRGFALGAMQGAETASQAASQGKEAPLGAVWKQNSDAMAKIRTGDKDARGGIAGSMMDRLNYGTRERRARFLGIGNEDLAEAKYEKDVKEAQAMKTQQALDQAKLRIDTLPSTATAAERQRAIDDYNRISDVNDAYQLAAKKAAKKYDTMDKDRTGFGVAPRIGDKRRDKHLRRYRWNGEDYHDEDPGSYRLREGSYRSPYETTKDYKKGRLASMDYAELERRYTSGNMITERDIREEIVDVPEEHRVHKRDLKNFTGTADDQTIAGMGHGSGGGPGGPGPGHP